MGWLWTSVKVGSFGAAAYTLCKADVWGENKATIKYINQKCESCDKLKYYRKMVPSCEDMKIRWADSWNNGVRSVFSFVDNLPQHTVNGANWVVVKVQDLSSVEPPKEEKKETKVEEKTEAKPAK